MAKTTIFKGDVMKGLRKMADNSVDCIICSPPYWGLRDYGVKGQHGMEKSLALHIEKMVAVFEECRRVLKTTGTLWLNYGDCYATSPNGRSAAATKAAGKDDRTFRDKPFSTIGAVDKRKRIKAAAIGATSGNLKPKDLCMMPNRLAIALQNAGWWVRSEIIWAKPNAMPESVRDRPATSHEKIFLLTKSPKYYYNAGGVRQNMPEIVADATKGKTEKPREIDSKKKQRGHGRRHDGFNDRWDKLPKAAQRANGRALKNYEPAPVQVWEMATASFKKAHFATFPPELVERCIAAGCPPGGMVFDPYGGAGTTGMVASQMDRDCHLIELNADYVKMAWQRIKDDAPLVNDVRVVNMQGEMFK